MRMAGSTGRATSDASEAQQVYEAADAAKEAAEADNLLDAVEIERFVLQAMNQICIRVQLPFALRLHACVLILTSHDYLILVAEMTGR